MGVLWDLLGNFFGKKDTHSFSVSTMRLQVETAYKRLYVNSAIELIARSLAACEFDTYRSGELKKSLNYYQLNVAPNKNENAYEFWHKVVHALVYKNESLIIPNQDQLWVADSFFRDTTQGFKEFTYKNVVVNTEMLSGTFREQDVLYLKLASESINAVVDSLYHSYGQLLSKAIMNYKANGQKRFLVKGRHMNAITDEKTKQANELFEGQLRDYVDPEKFAAVFFLPQNVDLEDQSPEFKEMDTRDIKAIAKDMLEFVSTAFHIPPSILSGVSDGAGISTAGNPTGDLDNFMIFSVRPFGELITTEYNRKMFRREQFLKKTYIKFNTDNFKLLDINKLATAVDKLFAVGGLSINDVITRLGQEPINEEWANKRYVTKNYERADVERDLEGGEENDDGKDQTQISNDE
ncbi:phage portal protein [Bacillus cereus]|nr:phage portal protein [Bacillus cereus]MEB9569672.1 phage portal protein [Bacillus cereus]